MADRPGIQRSKSLGRADKKTYAFGSSTPRELSHLNLPHKYRVVSTGPGPRTRLGEALSSSPVRRIPDSKARQAPKNPAPPKSPERKPPSPKKKPPPPKAQSPKRRPPAKAAPKSRPPASDDDMFHIADLAPVAAEPLGAQENGISPGPGTTPEVEKSPDTEPAKQLADEAKSVASEAENETNGVLDEAKETVSKLGDMLESGAEYLAGKAGELREDIGEKLEDVLGHDDDAPDELADVHAQLHDAWKDSDEDEKGEKDTGDMEVVEESAAHDVDVEHHVEHGEEPPFEAHEGIDVPEEAEMTAGHTTEGMTASAGATDEAIVQEKPVVESLGGATDTGGAGSATLDGKASPREDAGLGSPSGEHDDEHVPSF